MRIEVTVGPPVLTINQGNTFVVSDLSGQIAADSEQGVFSNDTRFVSYYSVSANGEPWQRLSSSVVSYYAERIYLTNPIIETEDGLIEPGTVSLTICRDVGEGIRENFSLTNYGLKRARFNLEVAIRNDFADIFEVRAHKFVRRGRVESSWDATAKKLTASYTNRDFKRVFVYQLTECSAVSHMANGRIVFELDLEPGATATVHAHMDLLSSEEKKDVPGPLTGQDTERDTEMDRLHTLWKQTTTTLTSSNEDFYRLFERSVEDMGVLDSMAAIRKFGCPQPEFPGMSRFLVEIA